MMKIKVICPEAISGYKDDKLTFYKNPSNLYVAILNGVEVGLAKEIETETNYVLESSFNAKVLDDFENKFVFYAIA